MMKYQRRCLHKGCKLKAMTGMKMCYVHGPVSGQLILKVWWKLYYEPYVRVRKTAEELGTAAISIMRCLQWLDDNGILIRDRNALNARHIKFPPIVASGGSIYQVKWLDL